MDNKRDQLEQEKQSLVTSLEKRLTDEQRKFLELSRAMATEQTVNVIIHTSSQGTDYACKD